MYQLEAMLRPPTQKTPSTMTPWNWQEGVQTVDPDVDKSSVLWINYLTPYTTRIRRTNTYFCLNKAFKKILDIKEKLKLN